MKLLSMYQDNSTQNIQLEIDLVNYRQQNMSIEIFTLDFLIYKVIILGWCNLRFPARGSL